MTHFKLSKIMWIVFLIVLIPLVSIAQTSGYLFEDYYSEKKPVQPGPEVIREKYVRVNFDAIIRDSSDNIQNRVSDQIILNLFYDVEFIAQLDYIEKNPSGSFSWIGQIQGDEYNSVILTIKGDLMMGSVSTGRETYTIIGMGEGIHQIRQTDHSKYAECVEPIIAPESEFKSRVSADAFEANNKKTLNNTADTVSKFIDRTGSDNGSIIDVLVVYTTAAKNSAAAGGSINTLIAQAISESNTGFANSGVNHRFNLVHTAEVTYDETGFNWSTTLSRLRSTSDGYMDDVHNLRTTHGADEVVLLVGDTNSCGIAYVMQTVSSSFKSYAFSVVSTNCATGYYSFAHEIGHNMGCAHDIDNAGVTGAYSYSYGYQAPDAAFRTIMAYNCSPGGCTRVNYWSNPDKLYGGQPMGTVPSIVTTESVTSIKTTSATGRGTITDLGIANPTAHGVCWSKSSGPTVSGSHTDKGGTSSTGAFISSMTGLTASTKYYVRAYATNSAGTSYGNQVSFTAGTASTSSEPTVTTQAISNIDITTATGNGNITDLGSSNPTAHGVCWGTSSSPAISGSHTDEGGASSTGAFTSKITGLTASTVYYVRAYATNSIGTAYGASVKFTSASQAAIEINRTFFSFGSIGTVFTKEQELIISNSGGGNLNWSITDNVSWLTCSPASGTDDEPVMISVNPSGLAAGTYAGTITITDPDASNSPKQLAVSLSVKSSGTSTGPFGSFDSPILGSTVSSSIAVTGWVLDDIETVSVKIYRLSASNSLVYIGDAIFVEDARSDIELANPDKPLNYRAGWGYMLLTNFLPNGGNGIYTLQAIATDKEGKTSLLGSKTITCDNTNAVKPFGAIDSPGPGGIASGSKFRNQGWVLTPMPNTVPIDGSTIKVYIDGKYLGHPGYNVFRSDIAAYFPGYENSEGALAYLDFDTSTYSNGVHTIEWSATDNAGNTDGIGSRFFTIRNTSSDQKKTVSTGNRVLSIKHLNKYKLNSKPIEFTIGFNEKRQTTNDKRLTTHELQRIVVHLNQDNKNINYSGYLKVGDQLRKLPIGSNLKDGKFFWSPGPGFLGSYDLIFIDEDNKTRKEIRVIIKPEFRTK